MSKKIGRPTTPKSEAKSILFGALLSRPEAKEAEKAVASSGQDKSKWLRDAIKRKAASRPLWLRSKWTKEQLHGKLVEFRLIRPDWWVEGIGEFSVDEHATGEISIDISMRDLKPSDLVDELRLSHSQIARRASKIPGHKKTKGGHWRFRDCPKLRQWIKENKKSKRHSVTGPMEDLIARYSSYYLKRLSRQAALRFFIAADETAKQLEAKRQWMRDNLRF